MKCRAHRFDAERRSSQVLGGIEGGDRIALEGEIPLNTHGGQLSAGRLHGFGFLHEACVQLWGEAGARQVAGDPEVAVAGAGGGPLAGCLLLTRL